MHKHRVSVPLQKPEVVFGRRWLEIRTRVCVRGGLDEESNQEQSSREPKVKGADCICMSLPAILLPSSASAAWHLAR